MRLIIEEIMEALQSDQNIAGKYLSIDLGKQLQKSSALTWKHDYPVAIINTSNRVSSITTSSRPEHKNIFDKDGSTKEIWKDDELRSVASLTPEYLQTVSMMCLLEPSHRPLRFANKRPLDHWKKLQDVEGVLAMIEIGTFDAKHDICEVETSLRDIIRKRKEIAALKDIAFVWIAAVHREKDISKVMEHYFHSERLEIDAGEMVYHLGWSETLRAISMRSFVCLPKK